MALVIRFDRNGEEVQTRYLTSAFLQSTEATDLLQSFKSAITEAGLNLRKIINVPMDGPNLHKKFLVDLKADLRAVSEAKIKLIDFGTCILHDIIMKTIFDRLKMPISFSALQER